jgi:endoglucanase
VTGYLEDVRETIRLGTGTPALAALLVAALLGAVAVVGLVAPARAGSISTRPQCRDRFPAARDPSNPLMLPQAPGANPLTGASFFVDGPAHGLAAGAIAHLLGIAVRTPLGHRLHRFRESESWARFAITVTRRLSRVRDPSVRRKILLLEKIAAEPEVQRVSSYAQGGGPGAIYSQTEKLFCHNFTADRGAVPIISTYFLHADLHGCPTAGAILADRPIFERRVDEMARAIGNRPAVLLLETDAIGSSGCVAEHGNIGLWEAALRYEVDRMAALPHTVVYVEAGYSDSNAPGYTARVLNQVDIGRIRGFFTNDTHENWTINEVRWAQQIARRTHGAHFIVNTAQNGNGPKRNHHPRTQGTNDLCNPPGRGMGPRLDTAPGFRYADALLWTSVPGMSSGSCNGGPPPGTFWTARAIALAARANGRLGPSYPSLPY